MNNKLYFGDNLEIMREMPDNCIDLICTDPPFNSGRNYNAFLGSDAQQKAFTDIWTYDDSAIETRNDIENRANSSETYQALNKCLKGFDLVLQEKVSGKNGSMRSYISFMGIRLCEMHRLLKVEGSIYLHCDPNASHYLKCIMDVIFGQNNFRNEILWCYTGPSSPNMKNFPRKSDTILRYSFGSKWTFNQIRIPYKDPNQMPRKAFDTGNAFDQDEIKKLRNRGKPIENWWTDIAVVVRSPKERLGYPTQKPRALYERMIKSSSNEGDIVMDPFCGCGTTIDAAHSLNRRWIGIDLTVLALDPMSKRMKERHGLSPSINYEISGYPTTMQDLHRMLEEGKYHDVSNWAVTRLGFKPTKSVGDGGKDGIAHFQNWKPDKSDVKIYAEVKTGQCSIGQVKSFLYSMDEQNAEAGIFIMLNKPTSGMKDLASRAGRFEHAGKTYPKLQFWTIDDSYFENPDILKQNIQLPREWSLDSIRKSERHFDDTQMDLFEDKPENMSRPQLEARAEQMQSEIDTLKSSKSE